jgi:hypothetical protein
MTVRTMRLALAVFFFLAGAALLVVRFAAPEAVAGFDPTRLLIGALLALVLAGWNLMRWYASWMAFQERATPVRRPLQPGSDSREEEYNPDFDFGDKK